MGHHTKMPKSIQKCEPTLPINTYLLLFIFKFINTPSVRLQRLSGSQETVGWGPDQRAHLQHAM